MKSILIYSIFLSTFFYSCNSEKSIDDLNNDKKSPFIYVEVKNSDNTKDTIEFFIGENLIDSLKISKTKLVSICEDGSLYGDWNVKFKPTYKYEKTGFISYEKETDEITVSIDGTCENGYGVRDNIHNLIYFNRNGSMVYDKDNIPKINTF
jgi:hypothetical protein